MTREEWTLLWREQRRNRPKYILSMTQCSRALEEVYGYIFTAEQNAFIHLSYRYKDKLNKSYFDKIDSWKPEAKKRSDEMVMSLIYSENPFLKMMEKGF